MEDNKNIKMPPKRRMGPPGRGMAPVEKAKDFKGSIGKLIRYIGSYKIAIIFVAVMAVCSTVFSVVGPKVLGKATTALSEGLVRKSVELAELTLERLEQFLYSCFVCMPQVQYLTLYRAG